ncbi:MAG: hypothetical protein M3O70_19820 [Actinomycetota bacterium]|nr:hypothetical protein [Actinomycetota bacterium]
MPLGRSPVSTSWPPSWSAHTPAAPWIELLDAGYEYDADLYRAWVPERIRRDFRGASIRRKDLAPVPPAGGC